MIYTTYLSYFKKVTGLNNPHFYFVMRDRGNNDVAPAVGLLKMWKVGVLTWEEYERVYLEQLRYSSAQKWMERVGLESKRRDVVLVCFEKNSAQCHRRLLAEEIVRVVSGTVYAGECGKD